MSADTDARERVPAVLTERAQTIFYGEPHGALTILVERGDHEGQRACNVRQE
jgi:hypothetical protein